VTKGSTPLHEESKQRVISISAVATLYMQCSERGTRYRTAERGLREQAGREKHQWRRRHEDIEEENCPNDEKERIEVREARREDRGKGKCVERPRQQEEESQVRCHVQVIA
jgi:hypothetical protein